MEREFSKLQDFIDAIVEILSKEEVTNILSKYEKYVKDHINESDFQVRNQKSLVYKWYCKKRWGHCFSNNADSGICLRCGAKVLPLVKAK